MAVDTPPEIKLPSQQPNPPAIIQTIEREYWVCKIVWWIMKMTKEWVVVTLENPEARKKIADTFNWSQDERKKLNEEVLVWNLRKKLIEKYPEQKCFFDEAEIKVMQLWRNYNRHVEWSKIYNTNIFLLYSPEWRLLSYLDKDWNTMFDVSNFNFDDDEVNSFWRDVSKTYIRRNDWKLELFDNWTIYPEWSREFNVILLRLFINRNLQKSR